jgi:TolB protein
VYSSIKRIVPGAPVCFLGTCFGGSDIVRWSLFVYDVSDESIEDVNTPPTGGYVPTVNRVLDKIAFMNFGLGLMLTTLQDGAPMQIIDDDRTINTPVMSPDGSRVTYMQSQPPSWQIVVAVWDGTNATLLTRNDSTNSVPVSNVAPTFSPDGNDILFLSNRNGKWEFFAINADGTNERQVLKPISDGMNIQYNYSGERVASWTQ